MEQPVVAVDPGREKCGVAVVHKATGVVHKEIVSTAVVAEVVAALAEKYQSRLVVIGDRTHSRVIQKQLQPLIIGGQPLTIVPVDEHRSSDEARLRYWLDHPPKGWKRFIPLGLQTPPKPIDDYVAVILAERYFRKVHS